MNERKALLFIVAVIGYCMYIVMWFMKQDVEANVVVPENNSEPEIAVIIDLKNLTQAVEHNVKPKTIPLFIKDACSILEVFTQKPPKKYKMKKEELSTDNNSLTVLGITVFLMVLLIHAILEVIQANEEEKAKRKLNPDGERRQSLAEFANKKPLRRESSRFGLQLFQISESFANTGEEEKITPTRRQVRPYTRGESINSYLSETHKKPQEGSAPASVGETPTGEPKLVKRQSVAKLFGARPVPMVRRSSFPALPLNPEVQALMLGHRQQSVDSGGEGDGKGRRVRIIRRY